MCLKKFLMYYAGMFLLSARWYTGAFTTSKLKCKRTSNQDNQKFTLPLEDEYDDELVTRLNIRVIYLVKEKANTRRF